MIIAAALEDLSGAIAKARGLIKPGRPHLVKRIGFLLSTGSSERNFRIGRYLATRKKGFRVPGTRKPRRGKYTGVYATGVNKALDALTQAFAKAKSIIRGFHGAPHTVIRDGKAMTLRPREVFRTSLKGGSDDLREAAAWSKKLPAIKRPKKKT